MLGVRWSHALFILTFIGFFSLSSYIQYEITLIPLEPMLWLYFNLNVSHADFITFLLTTSNLMFHPQQNGH